MDFRKMYLSHRFLVAPGVHDEKRPDGKSWKSLQSYTWDEEKYTESCDSAFEHGHMGIICGHPSSDLIVVDIDSHSKSGDDVDVNAVHDWFCDNVIGGGTNFVATPSGGLHLYFKNIPARFVDLVKNDHSHNISGHKFDIRSQGGWVVCPPSERDGSSYMTVDGFCPVDFDDLESIQQGRLLSFLFNFRKNPDCIRIVNENLGKLGVTERITVAVNEGWDVFVGRLNEVLIGDNSHYSVTDYEAVLFDVMPNEGLVRSGYELYEKSYRVKPDEKDRRDFAFYKIFHPKKPGTITVIGFSEKFVSGYTIFDKQYQGLETYAGFYRDFGVSGTELEMVLDDLKFDTNIYNITMNANVPFGNVDMCKHQINLFKVPEVPPVDACWNEENLLYKMAENFVGEGFIEYFVWWLGRFIVEKKRTDFGWYILNNPGSGKSKFADAIVKYYIGLDKYYKSSGKQINNDFRYNGVFQDKLFSTIDDFVIDTFENSDLVMTNLNSMITDEVCSYNHKYGASGIVTNNYINLILFSNKTPQFKIAQNDRRLIVVNRLDDETELTKMDWWNNKYSYDYNFKNDAVEFYGMMKFVLEKHRDDNFYLEFTKLIKNNKFDRELSQYTGIKSIDVAPFVNSNSNKRENSNFWVKIYAEVVADNLIKTDFIKLHEYIKKDQYIPCDLFYRMWGKELLDRQLFGTELNSIIRSKGGKVLKKRGKQGNSYKLLLDWDIIQSKKIELLENYYSEE